MTTKTTQPEAVDLDRLVRQLRGPNRKHTANELMDAAARAIEAIKPPPRPCNPAVPPACRYCHGKKWTIDIQELGRRVVCDECGTSLSIAYWEFYYDRPATEVR